MPEQPQIDVTAVITQINTLKKQRDNAMDDVAILMGRLESISKSYEDLKNAIPSSDKPENKGIDVTGIEEKALATGATS